MHANRPAKICAFQVPDANQYCMNITPDYERHTARELKEASAVDLSITKLGKEFSEKMRKSLRSDDIPDFIRRESNLQ